VACRDRKLVDAAQPVGDGAALDTSLTESVKSLRERYAIHAHWKVAIVVERWYGHF
jgi:hypothetical protein